MHTGQRIEASVPAAPIGIGSVLVAPGSLDHPCDLGDVLISVLAENGYPNFRKCEGSGG